MNFDPNVPIYLQIMDVFKKEIISGQLTPSSKVKSVRELAVEYGVNPNTVQRALSELERLSLLRSERTSGRFITDDESLISGLRKEAAATIVDDFIEQLHQVGFDDEEIIDMVMEKLNHPS